MMTHDTEGGDGPQHRSSVHIKLEHQGNLRMVQHGLRTIQTLHTSCIETRIPLWYMIIYIETRTLLWYMITYIETRTPPPPCCLPYITLCVAS